MAETYDRRLDIAPLTRRAWLTRVGLVVGAGLLAACAPAPPAAAPQPTAAAAKPAATTAPAAAPAAAGTPKRGGKITWAVPSLPNALPSGAIAQPPTHVLIYGSLMEWDRQLKGQPALAEST